jgi:hypothetical protein
MFISPVDEMRVLRVTSSYTFKLKFINLCFTCKRKSVNQLRIFGDRSELKVVLYKPCFDLSWAETLGACASLVVSLAHRERTGRTTCTYCSTPLASYKRSAHHPYVTAKKKLCKVNCRINYFVNDTAILLSPLCWIVQAVKTVTPVTCADIPFCLHELWYQLIKLTVVCLITSRHPHWIINIQQKEYTFSFGWCGEGALFWSWL